MQISEYSDFKSLTKNAKKIFICLAVVDFILLVIGFCLYKNLLFGNLFIGIALLAAFFLWMGLTKWFPRANNIP